MSKNTRNRILLTALAALLLVTLTIGGTLAWLVDKTDDVVNTFTTSEVDIDLNETAKNFKMVPGASIAKDPIVTVEANSETCWLFVQINESENLDTYIDYKVITAENDTPDPKYTYHWSKLSDGVYYMEVPSSAQNTSFSILMNDQVTVKGGVTNSEMDAAETNKPTLTFTAYAIQKASFDNVSDAWTEAQKTKAEYGLGAETTTP